MILLTEHSATGFRANGRQRDVDHIPVVKFFNPFGAGVWLATELDQGGDIMFGLADIGYLELCRGAWKSCCARSDCPSAWGSSDLLFAGDVPIPVWAEAARETGSIRAAERVLYRRFGAAFTRTSVDTESRES